MNITLELRDIQRELGADRVFLAVYQDNPYENDPDFFVERSAVFAQKGDVEVMLRSTGHTGTTRNAIKMAKEALAEYRAEVGRQALGQAVFG